MRILFLGDVVGNAGCSKIIENLSQEIKKNEMYLLCSKNKNNIYKYKI